MPLYKKVSGKKYWFYDKYDTKKEALEKALKLKEKSKENGGKIKTYIEEIGEFGGIFELFTPTDKFYLWIHD